VDDGAVDSVVHDECTKLVRICAIGRHSEPPAARRQYNALP
jgi:hypothetical protein